MTSVALFGGVPISLDLIEMGRWLRPPTLTRKSATKQPHRKTGVAQARRDARKRRNRK